MFFAANAAHITSDFPNPYRYCLTKVVGNISESTEISGTSGKASSLYYRYIFSIFFSVSRFPVESSPKNGRAKKPPKSSIGKRKAELIWLNDMGKLFLKSLVINRKIYSLLNKIFGWRLKSIYHKSFSTKM